MLPPALSPVDSSIVRKLATVVSHVVAKNQDIVVAQGSPFVAPALPPISVADYLDRMLTYMHCSTECFVVASVLITRLEECSQDPSLITPASVHRLLLASVVVAAKMQDDLYMSNTHYAAVGGVSLAEMNALERCLVSSLGFDLLVTPEQYSFCLSSLDSLFDMLTASSAPEMVHSARLVRRSSSAMLDRVVDEVLESSHHNLPGPTNQHPHALDEHVFSPIRERRGSSVSVVGAQ